MNDLFRCLLSCVFTLTLAAQAGDAAKRIYDSTQESVFLVYLNDVDGKPEALGSAFLIAPKMLITNAHVVREGTPVLAVGPVRIPVTVVATDNENDLAILSVSVDLTSKPLALASAQPTPGERVFAIGNPEGLEKTISEGLVSGVRSTGDRTLLQITSPISHGSSGGPILNSDGLVVGVAVGMFTDGQNLNFAVPALYVKELLNRKSQLAVASDSVTMADISKLVKDLEAESYSADEGSQYQRNLRALTETARKLVATNNEPNDLRQMACISTNQWSILQEGVQAARKLYERNHVPDNAALVAYLLSQKFNLDDLNVAFAKEGTPEMKQAQDRRASSISALEGFSMLISPSIKSHPPALYSYAIAHLKAATGDTESALSIFQEILPKLVSVCGNDLKLAVYQEMISAYDKLKRVEDAEHWFRAYAKEYTPTPWEWDSEGDRRDAAHDYPAAALANENAARGSEYLTIDYCWAAQERYNIAPLDGDVVLADARKCIDASVKNKSENQTKRFEDRVPVVQRLMAEVLEDRGVHEAALGFIKSSLSAKPDDPASLHQEAVIFGAMGRASECVAASQAAITASDGKFKFMHFTLGNCYFDLHNWEKAANSFKIAADSDKNDPAPAYNLALCYQRQGFGADAREWFNEALKRNPSPQLRQKIIDLLKSF